MSKWRVPPKRPKYINVNEMSTLQKIFHYLDSTLFLLSLILGIIGVIISRSLFNG
ncbi:MAG: hypothetical protein INQ03_13585 [Candidatus Heimdallarchaeota archaeon]|nr:hypothetical protein [Candidatus Heimdallarchaeota archaeon]